MNRFPDALDEKLKERTQNGQLRILDSKSYEIDFFSNDYLGLSRNHALQLQVQFQLASHYGHNNGATGSRLISGNHSFFQETEEFIANFHQSEGALIYNSGYDANLGFWSAVPQKNDLILYDALCHASIRDGLQLSQAKSYKFRHHDWEHLKNILDQFSAKFNAIYIVTETVFSMDGDVPDLMQLIQIAENYGAYVVLDEAHALGVFGVNGVGLTQSLGLEERVFARIMTFGKSLGCHGAVILGSQKLIQYLTNFSRSFIYTTGLPPHSIATIYTHYQYLTTSENLRLKLLNIIQYFQHKKFVLNGNLLHSPTPIQTLSFENAKKTKSIAYLLQQNNIGVKAIMPPTVPIGSERLRICLHSYNTYEEINLLFDLIQKNINDSKE
jgi:8-amino-7-oxononanoate synthase